MPDPQRNDIVALDLRGHAPDVGVKEGHRCRARSG